MYAYIIGIVTDINNNYITVENNKIGYLVLTPSPNTFKKNEENKVYLYEHIKEDEHILYGFPTNDEKNLFLKLISVKGLGCKMAISIMATNKAEELTNAILNENISYLKKIPKVGEKLAKQIILDLKGTLNESNNQNNDELINALKSLGYKANDYKEVLKNIDNKKTIEEQIKESLKQLLK